MTRIRVLLVEDSLTVRKRLAEVLNADGGFEVVGEAADGARAIELCQSLRPNAITMDLQLPGINGLTAIEQIMAHCPTPILVVSGSLSKSEVFNSYEALAAGAVEVFEKPNGVEASEDWERGFLSTLRIVSRVRVITHVRARLRSRPPVLGSSSRPPPPIVSSGARVRLVAIGASTGGPTALVDLFSRLPSSFNLPILLVLHIGEPFAPAFADWLRSQVGRSAAYASEGEPLDGLGGRIRMAPPDRHMLVRNGRLTLSAEPPRHSCRPSVDVLFESLAREYGASCGAALLTGMGRDGAAGLLELRRAGALTLAQDEQSCVVYGMPREAVLLGAAQHQLNPIEIAQAFAAFSSGYPASPP
jgi:two-component system chemotaxis response regulator CheB